jgi:hypothetical protein
LGGPTARWATPYGLEVALPGSLPHMDQARFDDVITAGSNQSGAGPRANLYVCAQNHGLSPLPDFKGPSLASLCNAEIAPERAHELLVNPNKRSLDAHLRRRSAVFLSSKGGATEALTQERGNGERKDLRVVKRVSKALKTRGVGLGGDPTC